MDDALILIPIIETFNYLKHKKELIYTKTWLERAEKEFQEIYINEWINIDENRGYFQDIYYTKIGINMPMNQIAVVGEFCAVLYEATGKKIYKDYAIKTANYIKSNLIIDDDSYIWYYAKPSTNNPDMVYEDFSHAQLVWRFVYKMYNLNLVFNNDDINLFKGTFKNKIIDGNKIFWFLGGMIDENTPASKEYLHKEKGWLHYFYSLTIYDNEIKNILKNYHNNRNFEYIPGYKFNHIGELFLLHFAFGLKYFNLIN